VRPSNLGVSSSFPHHQQTTIKSKISVFRSLRLIPILDESSLSYTFEFWPSLWLVMILPIIIFDFILRFNQLIWMNFTFILLIIPSNSF